MTNAQTELARRSVRRDFGKVKGRSGIRRLVDAFGAIPAFILDRRARRGEPAELLIEIGYYLLGGRVKGKNVAPRSVFPLQFPG